MFRADLRVFLTETKQTRRASLQLHFEGAIHVCGNRLSLLHNQARRAEDKLNTWLRLFRRVRPKASCGVKRLRWHPRSPQMLRRHARKPRHPSSKLRCLKTTTREVLVDVVVTKSNGDPVLGLGEQDLR